MLKSSEMNMRMVKYFVEDQEDELDQLRKMYKTEDLTEATADIVIRRAVRRLELSKEMESMYVGQTAKVKEYQYPIHKTRVTDALEGSKQSLEQVKVNQALSKVTRDTALANAQAAFELAELKVTDLKKDLEQLTVKAPFDGVVLYGELTDKWQRNDPDLLRTTEKIGAHQVVMTLYTPGKLRLNVSVPESKLLWAGPDAEAPVTPAALPQVTYGGKVARGNASVSEFLVTLPEVDQRIVPGMKGSVHVDGGRAKDVIVVPLSAVRSGKVWVRTSDGKEPARSVTLGLTDGTSIEVNDGLSEGDQILEQPPK
jgi:multidrug efflux pump subunit AcrA (membrane-fusion protein)